MLSRSEYWVRIIGTSVLAMVLPIVLLLTSIYLFNLILIGIVALAVVQWIWAVQRFHDVGLSGAWLLLNFIPVIGNLAVFIMLCLPSDTFHTYGNGRTGRI